MTRAAITEHVIDVFKIFIVAALVRRQRDALNIFLYRSIHDFFCASVVSEMDDFCTGALHDPPHDIDGGIVAVK